MTNLNENAIMATARDGRLAELEQQADEAIAFGVSSMQKIEYQIIPVTRYVIKRFEQGEETAGKLFASSIGRGEFDDERAAFEVAYALCRGEHEALGLPIDDERISYPILPSERPASLAPSCPAKP